jgi:Uma2 family endonuclease
MNGPAVATATGDDGRARARRLVPEQRVAFQASWDIYEALTRAIGDQPVRVAFDGERVELMSPSQDHDELKIQAGLIVRGLAAGLGVACRGVGSTTRRQPPERGLEPDESFYLTPGKIAEALDRRRGRPLDSAAPPGPVPDLAVEIDLSPSSLDRPSLYAALGVVEVWRYDGERVVIERLTPEGTLAAVPASGFLGVRADELESLLVEDVADDNEYAEHVKTWARDVLTPRLRP